MQVVVNQLAALGQRTGIGHYTVQLLRCLQAQAGPDVVEGFPQGWVRRLREKASEWRPRLEGGPAYPQENGSLSQRCRRSLLSGIRQLGRAGMGWYFRRECRRRRYDLYHETNFIPLPSDIPTLATLHDLSVLRHPEWHPADRVRHFEKHFFRGLKRCQHFLAISEFGRQEVISVLGIAPDRVTRTYMGIRPGLRPLPAAQVAAELARLSLPPRYLLCLGTIEPRKNLLRLLKAYCSLPDALRERWPLLLVGGWGWNTKDVADYFHREARHRHVLHLGYVEESQVPLLYNGARALLYPSIYEGFGLPPIEMLACGGAVLASTAGALRETVGGQAHLLDPHDEESWRQAMIRVVTEDEWWLQLRAGATAIAQPFTWERCAEDTFAAYRALHGQVGGSSLSALRTAA